jgi:ubiquinone/menaquinone biosynthesis C-methylase UbiE
MTQNQEGKINYGNWVSSKIILAPVVLTLVFATLSILSFLFLIPVVIFVVVAVYFAYTRYLFSPMGQNVQERVRNAVIENLHWDGNGKVLDIGCGSGALIIDIVKRFPNSKAIGVDYWGGNWEYSQKVCQQNAQTEKVADRVTFEKASASSLPFPDEQFDVVISNLVFHEVKDTSDKTVPIKEALRVLKKGGKFSLQDLLYMKNMFGTKEQLLNKIKSWGVKKVEFVETRNSLLIPVALKVPFMVGALGLIKGEK